MKAANCSGVISSFFTYTNQPVWDEIDIEFLGKDMTRVQFNYYTNGVGGHEFYFDLGFDASEDFHEYAFDWQRDSITWYIDGKAVYRATRCKLWLTYGTASGSMIGAARLTFRRFLQPRSIGGSHILRTEKFSVITQITVFSNE